MSDLLERNNTVLTLNNGITMPLIGLGVFNSRPEETAGAVEAAVARGYRLVDTAAAYFNERQVGEGIRRSGIDRAELFVTTKLWIKDYGYEEALRAFDRSLAKLGLDQVDLYLLHWPVPSDFERTLSAWKAAETLLADGRVRAIGVSNFGGRDLDQLLASTNIVPAVNQVELHPFFSQPELRAHNERLNIVTQAWSPIGGINRYSTGGPDVLKHAVIQSIATKHGKTPAQVVLRWQIQHGISAVPKSVHPSRIAENNHVFDFALSDSDLAAIDVLNTGSRSGPDPDTVNAVSFDLTVDD